MKVVGAELGSPEINIISPSTETLAVNVKTPPPLFLPHSEYTPTIGPGRRSCECLICQTPILNEGAAELLVDSSSITHTPCGNTYHLKCIARWIAKQPDGSTTGRFRCPRCCRNPVPRGRSLSRRSRASEARARAPLSPSSSSSRDPRAIGTAVIHGTISYTSRYGVNQGAGVANVHKDKINSGPGVDKPKPQNRSRSLTHRRDEGELTGQKHHTRRCSEAAALHLKGANQSTPQKEHQSFYRQREDSKSNGQRAKPRKHSIQVLPDSRVFASDASDLETGRHAPKRRRGWVSRKTEARQLVLLAALSVSVIAIIISVTIGLKVGHHG